jgi:cytochrome bd-type quinol oxidase subunit 2
MDVEVCPGWRTFAGKVFVCVTVSSDGSSPAEQGTGAWSIDADLPAWLTSSALLLTLLVPTGIDLYPYLLPSNPHPERSFTINNAYSSHFAMQVGITWLAIGLVLALAHTSWVYYLFKGKVRLEEGSHY